MAKILASWLLIIPFLTSAQSLTFPPMDDSGKDPELYAFVAELKRMVHNREGQKVMDVVHPKIQLDFDEAIGKEKFKSLWAPKNKSSDLWTIMDRILGLGGVFVRNRTNPFYDFVFPYVNAIELEDPDLYFNTLVVTGKDVNVREKPDLYSKVVGRLTYDIVTYNYEKSQMDNWYFVETADKSISGYVSADFAYSPVDYRMFLTKENGKWMISCLVAGD